MALAPTTVTGGQVSVGTITLTEPAPLAGAVIYALLMFRYVAIKLVFIVGIAAMVTVWKMVTSLFIKIEREDPGRALREEEAPALFALTREVATAVGTRPLDEIRHGVERPCEA